jgi:DNA-binding HxlR family transcriptional regulator
MGREHVGCPVEFSLLLLGNKWQVFILRVLFTGTKRLESCRGAYLASVKDAYPAAEAKGG